MKIEYLGHASFLLTCNSGVRILTDPYQDVGYEMPSGIEAEIVSVSHGHFDHNYISALQGVFCLLNREETGEMQGIAYRSVLSFHDGEKGALRGENLVFLFEIDNKTVCHLGDLGEECSQELLDKIGKVDILFIPIGGKYTINATQAKKYIEKIKPKIAIPMHYKPNDGILDISTPQEFLNLFEKDILLNGADGETVAMQKETKIVFMHRGEKICVKM